MTFENRFSLSASKIRTMRLCARKLHHTAFGFWNGWQYPPPDDRARAIYTRKRAHSVRTKLGSLVHDAVTRHLRNGTELEALVEVELRDWRQWLRDARAERWRRNPKRYPACLELLDGGEIPELDKVRADLESMIRTALETPVLRMIWDTRRAGHEPVLRLEEGERILRAGVTLWIIPDLVTEWWEDGECLGLAVVDWKTGKLSDDPTQVLLYALWCEARLGRGRDLSVALVSLRTGEHRWHEVTPELLDQAARLLSTSVQDYAGLLVDRDLRRNEPLGLEHFEPANNGLCAHCEYRPICDADGVFGAPS